MLTTTVKQKEEINFNFNMEEQKEKKVIFAGSNDQQLIKLALSNLSEEYCKNQNITIYTLEEDEIAMLVDLRLKKTEAKTLEDFLGNDQNRAQAKRIAEQFHKQICDALGSENMCPPVKKSFVKNLTNVSWTKFNEIISMLDVFGFINWTSDKKEEFAINITDEDILISKKLEIRRLMELGIGILTEFQDLKIPQKEKDKIETLKGKMKNF